MKYLERFLQRPFGNGRFSYICTPDGGLLYISLNSATFIEAPKNGENPLVRVYCTKMPISALDIDPGWSEKEKLFATLTVENSVLIWDIEKSIAISGHKAHCSSKQLEGRNGKSRINQVFMSFMKNRNLLTIGYKDLVVYCVASNSTFVRANFLRFKLDITDLKCSPFDEHIFACGTNKGAVHVCDLQKSCILYTFNTAQTSIVSLAWSAVELSTNEKKLVKTAAISSPNIIPDSDDIFNIYDYDYLENEFGAPVKVYSNDNDECQPDAASNELALNPNFNFTEACMSLKEEINALNENKDENRETDCEAVTLADCQQSNFKAESTSSEEGSLELVEHNSSTDDSCHVDGTDVTVTEQCERNETTKVKDDIIADKVVDVEKNTMKKKNFDILLTAASADSQFLVYNTMTGGFCDQYKKDRGNADCKCIWISSTELLLLTVKGDLIRKQLNGKRFSPNDAVRSYKFDNSKDEIIYNNANESIQSFGATTNASSNLLWFVTKQRQVVCMNMKTRKIILNYGTATNSIYHLSECPDDNMKIAMSLANFGISILNSAELATVNINLNPLRIRANGPVKSIAWHSNGYDLAYGTLEGQVGIYNVDTNEHTPFNFVSARPIYGLTWRNDHIFFVCNDMVYAYKAGSRDPIEIDGCRGYFSSVAVHNEFLLLGTSRGELHIYREKDAVTTTARKLSFKLIQELFVANHYITDIAFNRIETQQFAMAANEAFVYILNFDAKTGMAQLMYKLNCGVPKAQIYKVKWSNRQASKLITCGLDGGLRLFDLSLPVDRQLVFTKQFHCPLFSTMFLPMDERYVLCTGKTITIEVVDTEAVLSTELNTSKSDRALDSIKWAMQTNVKANSSANKRKREKKLGKALKAEVADDTTEDLIEKVEELGITEKTNEDEAQTKVMDKESQAQKSNFLKNPQTLLSLINKEQNKHPLIKIHEFLTISTFKEKRDNVLIANLFRSKTHAEHVLKEELANLKSAGASVPEVGKVLMNQINGDLRNYILNAIQKRELNEWHISLSPSISYSFWQKCCQAFVEQLLEQGYALQAASFLLGLHKQNDAIEMLLSHLYFKEALLIGRVYLKQNDTYLDEIVNKWIQHLESQGNLPAAALICTVSEQYRRAYEILSKQRVAGPEIQAVIELLKQKIN